MLIAIAGVAFAMPAITREHYAYVPQALLGIPVVPVRPGRGRRRSSPRCIQR